MAALAPAIIDVRPMDGTPGIARWLRGIGVRQVLLVCGLIMFSYIFSHFFNHALGNFSYDTMEAWLRFHVWWWRIPIVNFALYAAAATHFSLGLWALYQSRHFRYTAIELVFGLSIPLLIASHFGIVRLGGLLFGRDPPIYASPLFAYWVNRPYIVGVQFLLAVLLPPLAMTGTHRGAHEVTERASQPQWRNEHIKTTPLAQRALIEDITLFYFPIFYMSAIVLVFVARGVRALLEDRRGTITVSYPNRRVRVPRGLSILETSLRFNVPHASVCGGRARCSTCRVRIVSDRALPPPSGREAFVLARVGAAGNPAIRLACQLRPQADVAVIPVLPANVGADFVRNRKRVNIGEERYVVNMFIDMRGSTRLAEARLPFDTVFLINRFLEAASQAVVDAGGQPNQFVGDGLLALFGLHVDPATAGLQAIRAAAMVASNVEQMNRQFASELQEPIQFGIGIHGGEVIIGDIGFRDHTVFTALGDAVNVAARLQDMTKALNCTIVVSEEVCKNAGIAPDRLMRTEVSIRGRDQPMTVCAASDPASLAGLLEERLAASGTERVNSRHQV
jgi:adenylate cyclase